MNYSKTTLQKHKKLYGELKEAIKTLMHKNPQIRVGELVAETGYSEYMVLRAYLPVQRELFARASR